MFFSTVFDLPPFIQCFFAIIIIYRLCGSTFQSLIGSHIHVNEYYRDFGISSVSLFYSKSYTLIQLVVPVHFFFSAQINILQIYCKYTQKGTVKERQEEIIPFIQLLTGSYFFMNFTLHSIICTPIKWLFSMGQTILNLI